MAAKLRHTAVASAIAVVGTCAALLLIGMPAASTASNTTASKVAVLRPAPIRGVSAARADRPDRGTPSSRNAVAVVTVPSGRWRALGPAPIGPPYLAGGGFYGGVNSGRITTLVQLPASGLDPGRLVAGSAGGGIWTSDNSGTSWVARSDTAADLAIGSVAVDPANANHLIAGTGEANQCGDCFPGAGILLSTDAGSTWTLQNPGNVFSGRHIEQVAIDPSNSNRQFAATDGGLFVTTNGGTSWAKPTDPSYATVDGNITGVVINPTTPTIVYISGGAKTVARSIDGGVHWAARSTGITAPGQSPLTAIAIAKSSPATLYAAVGSESPVAVYKTTNSGGSWSPLSATPDYTGQSYAYGGGSSEQGWYDNVLAVDPTNANHVVAGGIALVASTNGGSSWTNVNGQQFFGGGTNKLHPDQHAVAFASDATVWIGDDGGVFHYTPSSGKVLNVNSQLNITQLYYGFNVVGNTVLAGAQDNASSRTTSTSQAAWTGVSSGDGGPSAITPGHATTQFIESNTRLFVTTDAFATTLTNITPPQVSSTGSLFTPPDLVVPNTTTPASPTVYYGGQDLYRTTNPAAAPPTWTKVTSVGSSCAVGGTCVSAIAASTDGKTVYAGFTNGTIEVSTNSGVSFTAVATAPSPQQFVTGISVNPANTKAITASFSFNDTRYRSGLPHVYQYLWSTSASTGTWTNITGNLPNEAVSRVVYDSGALVAATDSGIYGTGAPNGGSTAWKRAGSGLPNVQVQDLFVNGAGLYAVTHGRGAWKLPAPSDLAVTVAGPATFPKGTNGSYTVTVINNGPASAATVKLTDAVPSGTTFVSQAQSTGPAFSCTNPAAGATGTTSCSISALASKASATFKLTYALPSSTTQTSVVDTAVVSSAINPDPTPANNTSTATTPVS